MVRSDGAQRNSMKGLRIGAAQRNFKMAVKSSSRGINKPYYDKKTNKEETTMKKNIIVVIVALAMLFGAIYLGTIRDGWYLTCNDGVETHWYYKTDVFGNRWITGNRNFYIYP